jgi:hypothetical protein
MQREKRSVCTDAPKLKCAKQWNLLPTFKFSGPAMVVASMMSDAQEMMAYEQPDFNTIEDQRQLLNRAKFVLFEYIMDKQNG